jgi:hypothetical protein
MCYNCGCGNPNDDMGNADNITTLTFDKAAKAEKQSMEEALLNTLELLQRQLKQK